MHEVTPEVFLIGKSGLDLEGVLAYLNSLGVSKDDWVPDVESNSDSEVLTEVASRSCYMSFGTTINANLTRVREGNQPHIKNILDSGHGSVLEHASATFAIRNISRVGTHEVVRHRAGWSYSQESLRYVRADDLGYYMPQSFKGNIKAEALFLEQFEEAEYRYRTLLKVISEQEGKGFSLEGFQSLTMDIKKKYTSSIRRVLPIGMATNIICTANMRALRHVIEMRTDPSAEEEIRLVFSMVADICLREWPNIFQDMHRDPDEAVYFTNKKV